MSVHPKFELPKISINLGEEGMGIWIEKNWVSLVVVYSEPLKVRFYLLST